jgi:hypothetical protein
MTEEQVRTEMVGILDDLAELPDEAIAERAALRRRQHELRGMLKELHGDRLEKFKAEWDAQAGFKLPEDEGDISGTIPSPSEMGSG